MKKVKLYRYIGKNGIITTPILLEGTKVYEMFTLIASEGKVLTDGEKVRDTVTIFADELDQWYEIDKIEE